MRRDPGKRATRATRRCGCSIRRPCSSQLHRPCRYIERRRRRRCWYRRRDRLDCRCGHRRRERHHHHHFSGHYILARTATMVVEQKSLTTPRQQHSRPVLPSAKRVVLIWQDVLDSSCARSKLKLSALFEPAFFHTNVIKM
jgi:hypothetical protein